MTDRERPADLRAGLFLVTKVARRRELRESRAARAEYERQHPESRQPLPERPVQYVPPPPWTVGAFANWINDEVYGGKPPSEIDEESYREGVRVASGLRYIFQSALRTSRVRPRAEGRPED